MNKITNKLKQLFSICLIFILIVSMFPGAVGAEEVGEESKTEDAEQTEDEGVEEENEDTSETEETSEQAGKETEDSDESTKEIEDSDQSHTSGDSQDSKDKTDDDASKEDEKSDETSNEKKTNVDKENNEPAEEEKKSTKEYKHDATEIEQEVKQSIKKAKQYYEENPPYDKLDYLGEKYKGSSSDYWILSALWGAGYKELKNDFPWKDRTPWDEGNYWTDHVLNDVYKEEVGIIIGSIVLGQDPRSFGEEDIVQKLIDLQNEQGLFYDEWGESWALIALDLVDADYNREKHINAILELQQENGTFDEWDDLEAMGWMLLALAPYMEENEEVKQAVEKSVKLAHDIFTENEEFQGEYGPNSNATSSIIMGLAAVGEDLYSEKWSKENGSLVEQLIDYQDKDGWFLWQEGVESGIDKATEQALLALVTVKNGRSVFTDLENYHSEDDKDDPEKEEPKPEPKPDKNKKVNLNEKTTVSKGQTVSIEEGKSQIVLPDNLPEGVALTVTIPNEKDFAFKEQNLKLVGDWFDFNFEGIERFNGVFTLTLRVNDGIDWDKAGVYYYNKESNQWELVQGSKNKEERTITVEVSEFSIYGVFEKEEEQTKVEAADGNNTNNPSETKEHFPGSTTNKQSQNGDRLPDTATNTFNIMLVGLFFLLLGSALIILRRKSLKKII